MILSGNPALLWEWKVLVCRGTRQQIELADFFCMSKPVGDLGEAEVRAGVTPAATSMFCL